MHGETCTYQWQLYEQDILHNAFMQIVVDSFNLKMDSAQHREGWSGSVTDVLGVIKGKYLSVQSVRIC